MRKRIPIIRAYVVSKKISFFFIPSWISTWEDFFAGKRIDVNRIINCHPFKFKRVRLLKGNSKREKSPIFDAK